MKPIIRHIAIALLCGAMLTPTIDAENRGRGRGGQPSHHTTQAPVQRPVRRPDNDRPGHGSQRPDNGRPGHGNYRPDNGHRQDNYHHYDRDYRHDYHHGHHRPQVHHGHHGPMRPHMLPPRPFHRPVPPPAWRPVPGWRPFHSILGVALGTAFNLSINALINSGYTVCGYGDSRICLANVPMIGLIWPDAVMYYNGGGALYGSQFVYSTPGYSMNQYNMAYTTLIGSYGSPYSIQNVQGGGVVASWWGPGGQFIRLSYQPEYSAGGMLRYYTTLSFGN